jgi:hypothetical protein
MVLMSVLMMTTLSFVFVFLLQVSFAKSLEKLEEVWIRHDVSHLLLIHLSDGLQLLESEPGEEGQVLMESPDEFLDWRAGTALGSIAALRLDSETQSELMEEWN